MISIDAGINLGSNSFQYILGSKSRRVVLFGPSGSGKSTLLKLVAGFFNPSFGSISINGQVLFDQSKGINIPLYLRRIGYLPQEYTLFPHMTVKQNIIYGEQFFRKQGKPVPSDCTSLAERLGIEDKLKAMPHELSGGEQQRVALARALYINPSLLLLDEPFSALDSDTRSRLRDLVLDITADMGIVTFFVTHDLNEAFIMGEDLAVIDQGSIREFGPVKDVFKRPCFIETARRLGFANEFLLQSLSESQCVTVNGFVFEHSAEKFTGSYMVIRPDQVMILREDSDSRNIRENVIPTVVSDIKERIRITDVRVTSQDTTFYISLPNHAAERLDLKVGKEVRISLKKESLVFCDNYERLRRQN